MNDVCESPQYVRMSTAAAIGLGLRRGRFYRNAQTFCINLLQTYQDGCKANCLYCGQAKNFIQDDSACERLIRVEWPLYSLEQVILSIKETQNHFERVCVSMLSHQRAGDDLITSINRLHEEIQLPISALITPTNLTRNQMEKLHEIGIDNLTIALDAVTKTIFNQLRAVKSPHRYDRYLAGLNEAIEIFGRGSVGVHLIVGLGETEFEITTMIQQLVDRGISIHLFSFYPEAGSAIGMKQPPPLGQYRRIQLVRYLIEVQNIRLEKLKFNKREQIIDFGLSPSEFDQILTTGIPFETSGCPGCNRPFANSRPSEPIRNYPFSPTLDDLQIIHQQIREYV